MEVVDEIAALIDQVHQVIFGGGLPGWEVGKNTDPGLLLVQEWWGITDIVKMQAVRLSQQGFRVFVADLYTHTKLSKEKGTTTAADREQAGHCMNTLDFQLATAELALAAAYLAQTGAPSVGVIGGCMGGALAFAVAERVPSVTAAVALYGTLEPLAGHLRDADGSSYFQVERIRIPFQYHTGMLDNIYGFSDPRTGQEVVGRMQAAGCEVEIHLYDDTPHSFLNALVPGGTGFLKKWDYGVPPQRQVELAFDRCVTFFHKHLSK
ncbi:MAG: hypothetical protein WDW36_002796 [Sanguina aurantia]